MERRWQEKTGEFKAVAKDGSIHKIIEYTTMRKFESFGMTEITEGLKVYLTDKSEAVNVNKDGSYTILTGHDEIDVIKPEDI